MDNLIAGIVAVGIFIVFLGFYAIKLNSIPLWIIMGGVFIMVIIEFVETLRGGNDLNGE
jgi:hypothetical protein